MIIEGLVIYSCLNSTGCTESSQAYYSQNASVREYMKNVEETIMKNETMRTLIPVASIVNGEYRINSKTVIKYKNDQIFLIMEFK